MSMSTFPCRLQWSPETSIFLTSDFKSSDRIERVLSFITNNQSHGTSENIPIGQKEWVGKLHQDDSWRHCVGSGTGVQLTCWPRNIVQHYAIELTSLAKMALNVLLNWAGQGSGAANVNKTLKTDMPVLSVDNVTYSPSPFLLQMFCSTMVDVSPKGSPICENIVLGSADPLFHLTHHLLSPLSPINPKDFTGFMIDCCISGCTEGR